MDIMPLVDKVRSFIEFETGLKTTYEFTGNGVGIALLSPTGWILGITCVKLSMSKMPLVFVQNTGFFAAHAGMTLASQFRSAWADEQADLEEALRAERESKADVQPVSQDNLVTVPEFLRSGFGEENSAGKLDVLVLDASMRI